jgi:hypothetical protein
MTNLNRILQRCHNVHYTRRNSSAMSEFDESSSGEWSFARTLRDDCAASSNRWTNLSCDLI